ncbi:MULTISPECIES: hypothetical protein [Vibrio]|uniref:Uncharacterized protein n=1 Tax=Vibrio lentus TaxID=136468 RepID=A0A2N7IIQ5_9VIBR|nr:MULTISPECIES: hypothetical protein [Vibrio]PMG11461.1 hypothetical protein BCU99_17305 [Vibrio cyclitrophicus]PML57512.1 hypothetical protein BCT74_19835 [Vibrio lentus]PMM51376.1 hypothetical protein BCT53_01160 [Vibrio lentus]
MESIVLTAEQVEAISEAFAIYGGIGVLVALFLYNLLSWFALKFVSWFRSFFEKPIYTDINERRARAKVSR